MAPPPSRPSKPRIRAPLQGKRRFLQQVPFLVRGARRHPLADIPLSRSWEPGAWIALEEAGQAQVREEPAFFLYIFLVVSLFVLVATKTNALCVNAGAAGGGKRVARGVSLHSGKLSRGRSEYRRH